MNNFVNVFTHIFFNEILYDFKILKITDLLNNEIVKKKSRMTFHARLSKKNVLCLNKKQKTQLIMLKS